MKNRENDPLCKPGFKRENLFYDYRFKVSHYSNNRIKGEVSGWAGAWLIVMGVMVFIFTFAKSIDMGPLIPASIFIVLGVSIVAFKETFDIDLEKRSLTYTKRTLLGSCVKKTSTDIIESIILESVRFDKNIGYHALFVILFKTPFEKRKYFLAAHPTSENAVGDILEFWRDVAKRFIQTNDSHTGIDEEVEDKHLYSSGDVDPWLEKLSQREELVLPLKKNKSYKILSIIFPIFTLFLFFAGYSMQRLNPKPNWFIRIFCGFAAFAFLLGISRLFSKPGKIVITREKISFKKGDKTINSISIQDVKRVYITIGTFMYEQLVIYGSNKSMEIGGFYGELTGEEYKHLKDVITAMMN